MNPSGCGGEPAIKLLGEAEGEGAVEAGAEGEDLVGEQLLGGALPPALLPPGRRRLGGGEGRSHRALAGGGSATTKTGREERRREIEVFFLLRQRCGGWVGLGRAREKRQAVPFLLPPRPMDHHARPKLAPI